MYSYVRVEEYRAFHPLNWHMQVSTPQKTSIQFFLLNIYSDPKEPKVDTLHISHIINTKIIFT
jgi:hypothetical protein